MFSFCQYCQYGNYQMGNCDFFFIDQSSLCFVTDHFDGQINSVKILPFHLASHISLYLENVAITDLLNYPACLNGLLDICAKQGEFVSNHLIFLWFSYYDRSVQSKQLQYSAASREGSMIFLYDLGYVENDHTFGVQWSRYVANHLGMPDD